jgi:hypothetical protein
MMMRTVAELISLELNTVHTLSHYVLIKDKEAKAQRGGATQQLKVELGVEPGFTCL